MPIFKRIQLPPNLIKYVRWAAGPLILGIISFIFVNPLLKHLSGPNEYIIYVVGNLGDKSSKDIEIEFISSPYELDIDGVKVLVKSKNDHGDPDKAREISERLANEDNTLMVVGHFLSSTTKAALPAYTSCKPPIPVILTTETNPTLIPNNNKNKVLKHYKPLYALSPDDNNQAKIAAEHAIKIDNGTHFWVVLDNSNKVYSSYLAMNFIQEIQKKVDKKVMLLTDINSVPPIATIKKLKIDCLFFAGEWQNALILTNQVNAIYEDEVKKPKIILSDYCVDDRLIRQGKDAVKGIYLTHQMKRKDFEKRGGWGYYGKKAAKIVEKILNHARNNVQKKSFGKWLGINRVEDARRAIKKSMFKILYGEQGIYRDDSEFQVWQIKQVNTDDGKNEYKFVDCQ